MARLKPRVGCLHAYETSLPKVPANPLQPEIEALWVLWRTHSRGASIHTRGDGALERKAAELEAARKQKQLAQEATPVVQPSDSVIIPIIIP
jgi:hypothetical protein